jgi:hypothetical protein
MHMQRRMYHRFDGYEELKPLLEGSDGEILAAFTGKPVLIRIPAASTVGAPRARLVSCLLHGNEPSGFQAMVEILRRGERFPFDLWVLIGNVRAATEAGLYAHRHLDDQEDFNRVWDAGTSTDMRRCATAILDELRAARLEAAVDVHNNSGRNPYHAILTHLTPEGRRLASMCADTVLLWRLRAHTLMEALEATCPAVSVECGPAHETAGTTYAAAMVHRFLTADGFTADGFAERPGARPQRVVETVHRVSVRPEVDFSFGLDADRGAGFIIDPGLDLYNFDVMPARRVIGRVRPGAAMPLVATDMSGHDVTDQLFCVTPDSEVILTGDVMPIMMTTTVQQARRDCLFYTALPVA